MESTHTYELLTLDSLNGQTFFWTLHSVHDHYHETMVEVEDLAAHCNVSVAELLILRSPAGTAVSDRMEAVDAINDSDHGAHGPTRAQLDLLGLRLIDHRFVGSSQKQPGDPVREGATVQLLDFLPFPPEDSEGRPLCNGCGSAYMDRRTTHGGRSSVYRCEDSGCEHEAD